MRREPWRVAGELRADLCVLGAGAGGLSVAAGAAQMGAAVVLVEPGRMGGDCLNTGCVPSKALLAAAHAAQAVRGAGRFGIMAAPPSTDLSGLRTHVHGAIAAIAPHDSEERFSALGVTVLRAPGRFLDPGLVEAGGERVRARRFVIATGSSPLVPAIPGLAGLPCLTNEDVFALAVLPTRLLVLGGGPMGLEMAQAFRRLGAAVTVVQRGRILPRDEPEAAAVLRDVLLREGVTLHEQAEVVAASGGPGLVRLELAGGAVVEGSHLLLAAGRRAALDGLGLGEAGIRTHADGIVVDAGMRTTNRRVFAVGDVTGGPRFTHAAAQQAGIVLRRALFSLPARLDDAALPWVTFTDPEAAQVGLTEAAARAAGRTVTIVGAPLSGNDRAVCDGTAEGFVKLVLGRRGRLLGATVVAPRAGEIAAACGLAIQNRLGARALAAAVPAYPTTWDALRRAAAQAYAPTLFGPTTRRIVGLIQRLIP